MYCKFPLKNVAVFFVISKEYGIEGKCDFKKLKIFLNIEKNPRTKFLNEIFSNIVRKIVFLKFHKNSLKLNEI